MSYLGLPAAEFQRLVKLLDMERAAVPMQVAHVQRYLEAKAQLEGQRKLHREVHGHDLPPKEPDKLAQYLGRQADAIALKGKIVGREPTAKEQEALSKRPLTPAELKVIARDLGITQDEALVLEISWGTPFAINNLRPDFRELYLKAYLTRFSPKTFEDLIVKKLGAIKIVLEAHSKKSDGLSYLAQKIASSPLGASFSFATTEEERKEEIGYWKELAEKERLKGNARIRAKKMCRKCGGFK